MLIKHKEKCEQPQEIIGIRTSSESQIYQKKNHFHKSPLIWMIN